MPVPSEGDLRARYATLAEREARLRAALEATVDVFVVLAAVRDEAGRVVDFRVTDANERLSMRTGLPRERLVGRLQSELWPSTRRNGLFESYASVVESQQRFEGDVSLEPDDAGSERVRWVRQMVLPFGEGVIATSRDVTQTRMNEKRLELQELILRNMSEGVCLVRARDARIVFANPRFERMFGYAPGEMNDLPVSKVNAAESDEDAVRVAQSIIGRVQEHGEARLDIENVRKDGSTFWCRAHVSQFDHPDYGRVWVAVHEDITERRAAQLQLERSLQEKEVLLREVHHRVKNNLQVISSLLRLQSDRIKDDAARSSFVESEGRVRSIALLHETLYRSADFAHIQLDEYLRQLADAVVRAEAAFDVEIVVEGDHTQLRLDEAVPCSLLVNELLTNALKHAFPPEFTGPRRIEMRAREEARHLVLEVRDHGVGLPKTLDVRTGGSLGLQLVRTLTRQLHGTLTAESNGGALFRVRFERGEEMS